jgi:aryl-alcohol dehydrogenase-like predicted oxidoreductase
MSETRVTRREFVQDAAAAAAAAALGAAMADPAQAASPPSPDPTKTRSYNENMEYRRLGRTNMMLSAVSMGGHWKQMPFAQDSDDFKSNRREVMAAALDHGINYIDACWAGEVLVYAEALRGKRDKIYFGFDWYGGRDPNLAGSLTKMKEQLDQGLRDAKLDEVDVWRVTMREQGTKNTDREIETVAEALAWGKKIGKARAGGISTHHRPWIAEVLAKYPSIDVIVTPYSAGSKEKPKGSMFDALRKHDVGMIGIKPFASGTVFKSQGRPDSPTKAEDDERARLCLRHVLCCDVLAASIPGLITVDQVKNAAAAVRERRQLDLVESARHEEIVRQMWASLPRNYQWLRTWEWV